MCRLDHVLCEYVILVITGESSIEITYPNKPFVIVSHVFFSFLF